MAILGVAILKELPIRLTYLDLNSNRCLSNSCILLHKRLITPKFSNILLVLLLQFFISLCNLLLIQLDLIHQRP